MNPQEKKLFDIAKQLCKPELSNSKEFLLENMTSMTNGDHDRARNGLNMMIKCGALERTLNPNLFYLGGSTPF